jgi:hypothetical protein
MKELFRRAAARFIRWALYDASAAERYRGQNVWGKALNRLPLGGWIDEEL